MRIEAGARNYPLAGVQLQQQRIRFDFDAMLRSDPYRLFHAIGAEAWLRQVLKGELREPEIPEPEAP